MPYLQHTPADREKMLKTIGAETVEELFNDIPEDIRFPDIGLEAPLTESEILKELRRIGGKNASGDRYTLFIGAGAYNHFIPSVVDYLSGRGEFATAYTPYQPEASQGTLAALFEYQTMTAELLGMDVVNASHYDGATALAEALIMSVHNSRDKRKKVVLSPAFHPEYLQVCRNYLQFLDVDITGTEPEIGDPRQTQVDTLLSLIDDDTACLALPFPDFFGRTDDFSGIAEKVHEKGALFVISADPIAAGLYRSPGSYGADIVTGEGQSLGNRINAGGPFLGMFACSDKLVRRMPGRIAGRTVDAEGKPGFVLTLNTREQHIRREKATSNICTNQGLMALRASIYLAAMGPGGLRKAAELSFHKAHYAAEVLDAVPGFKVERERAFFKEFVLHCPVEAEEILQRLDAECIVPGLPLSRYFPDMKEELLVCVTEMNSKEEIDGLARALKQRSGGSR
jgi:glycine dehydrogenase subunit 1